MLTAALGVELSATDMNVLFIIDGKNVAWYLSDVVMISC